VSVALPSRRAIRETVVLARAVAYRTVTLRVRSGPGAVARLTLALCLFALLVGGGWSVAPRLLASSLEEVVVGGFVLLLAVAAFADPAWTIPREARRGTLDQFAMSPLGFGRVLAVRTAVHLSVCLGYGTAFLAAIAVTGGARLSLDPLTILPLALLTVAPAVGVGFALCGLTLAVGRLDVATRVVPLGFVALVALPVEAAPLLKLLPLALGSHLLELAMGRGVGLRSLPAGDLALLALTAVGYLWGGSLVFRVLAREARRRGTVGRR
jgi:ABC-2 type transport system permease protein